MKRYLLALPLLGALISRAHGAGWLPKVALSILWALPFGVMPIYYFNDIAFGVSLALIAVGLSALGKSTGHGGWMDLGSWEKPRSKERMEFIIKPLHGDMQEYWYDVLGMCLKGFLSVSGAIIAMGFINPLFSVIMSVGGLLCGLAYMIGWAVYPKQATVIGEVLKGVFAYGAIAICWGIL